jgi:hypothetical protein
MSLPGERGTSAIRRFAQQSQQDQYFRSFFIRKAYKHVLFTRTVVQSRSGSLKTLCAGKQDWDALGDECQLVFVPHLA